MPRNDSDGTKGNVGERRETSLNDSQVEDDTEREEKVKKEEEQNPMPTKRREGNVVVVVVVVCRYHRKETKVEITISSAKVTQSELT